MSAHTHVVHVREPHDLYIGRRARINGRWVGPSKWANPFRIGRDGTRDDVIVAYRRYVEQRPDLMAALGELDGQTLGCWCSPAACHGDVLAELVARASPKVAHVHVWEQDFEQGPDNTPYTYFVCGCGLNVRGVWDGHDWVPDDSALEDAA